MFIFSTEADTEAQALILQIYRKETSRLSEVISKNILDNQMNKPKEYDNYNYDMLAKNHIPKNEAYREPSGSQYENYGHSKNTYERPQPPKPKAQQKPEWRNNDEYE